MGFARGPKPRERPRETGKIDGSGDRDRQKEKMFDGFWHPGTGSADNPVKMQRNRGLWNDMISYACRLGGGGGRGGERERPRDYRFGK